MGDRNTSSSNATLQITIAVIGVIGVTIGALFTNWDKIFTKPTILSSPPPISSRSLSSTPVEVNFANGCKLTVGLTCIEYEFPIDYLQGPAHTNKIFTLKNLKVGDIIKADFKGMIKPSSAVAEEDPKNAAILITLHPPDEDCPREASCRAAHAWPNGSIYAPLEARYEMMATKPEQQFEFEINACVYKTEDMGCWVHDAVMKFTIQPAAQ